MNKYLFCFMLTVAFLLLSCSDDDHAEKTVFQAKDIDFFPWFGVYNSRRNTDDGRKFDRNMDVLSF